MKQSIGSYLPLEIQQRNDYIYHPASILLNTGRNALEYLLKSLQIKKIYIPYMYCNSIMTPINRLNIEYAFYHINEKQEPVFDFNILNRDDWFLYINYLGLRDSVANELSKKGINLISDNTQAFFSKPIDSIPTFYSTRKFFGVADGAVLCNVDGLIKLEQDKSADRMTHLLQRVENSSEVGYDFYNKLEEELDDLPIMHMSELTKRILLSVDFEHHKKVRSENFLFLNSQLKNINRYQFDENNINAPLAYPLWLESAKEIRKELVSNRVFTPRYWPNVIDELDSSTKEYDMAENIVPIPIDYRYTNVELQKVVDIIKKKL